MHSLTDVAIFFGTLEAGRGWLSGRVGTLQGPDSLELFVVQSTACLIVASLYFPKCQNTMKIELGAASTFFCHTYCTLPPEVPSLSGGVPKPSLLPRPLKLLPVQR